MKRKISCPDCAQDWVKYVKFNKSKHGIYVSFEYEGGWSSIEELIEDFLFYEKCGYKPFFSIPKNIHESKSKFIKNLIEDFGFEVGDSNYWNNLDLSDEIFVYYED